MDSHGCLPREWLGDESFPGDPPCSCELTGAPFEWHGPDCDRGSRPCVGEDTAVLVDEAVRSLVVLRGGIGGDAGAVLVGLASLIVEAQGRLPGVVAEARDQDYTWAEIAARLASRTQSVSRRYGGDARRRPGREGSAVP